MPGKSYPPPTPKGSNVNNPGRSPGTQNETSTGEGNTPGKTPGVNDIRPLRGQEITRSSESSPDQQESN